MAGDLGGWNNFIEVVIETNSYRGGNWALAPIKVGTGSRMRDRIHEFVADKVKDVTQEQQTEETEGDV